MLVHQIRVEPDNRDSLSTPFCNGPRAFPIPRDNIFASDSLNSLSSSDRVFQGSDLAVFREKSLVYHDAQSLRMPLV